MADDNGTPREQLVLKHISNKDGDLLVEVGKDNPRHWHSVVEEKTLTLTSVKAFVERSFSEDGCIDEDGGILDEESTPSITLTGVHQQLDCGHKVYAIDISEDDVGSLIAQRVDNNIGIDLTGRRPEQFYVGSLKTPYTSEVFVSTDGWYYGDAECIQLLFDVPEGAVRELRDILLSEDVKRLDLQVSLKRWVPVRTAMEGDADEGHRASIIYGYGGYARLMDWTANTRLF